MDVKLTERQKMIFKIVVDEYINNAQPVGSKEILHKYKLNISSATIRNEMAILEKYDLLEKTHTSSGRIPSTNGYKYYDKYISKSELSDDIRKRLSVIFANRNLSIDTIINESAEIISEILKLPSVITTFNKEDLLKRFEMIELNENEAMIILVTSSGTLNKSVITFKNKKQLSDISICIRIFNDRLVDTPLNKIQKKFESIKEIVRSKVHEYEYCLQNIINKIFEMYKTTPYTQKSNVSGTKFLTVQPEFKDVEKIKNVLDMLENSNIWKHISYNFEKSGDTKITFSNELGVKNVSVASTLINIDNKKHQLSVVGPERMRYKDVKGVLDFIKKEIENYK